MSHPNPSTKFWAVVPAAGVGSRMASNHPKQYLEVNGKMVIEHTLERLLNHPIISGVVIALGEHDEYWDQVHVSSDKPLVRVRGGMERSDSVLNALQYLVDQTTDQNNKLQVSSADWVLVHDAARPCVRDEDISTLIRQVTEHNCGGILALPVRDTMKRQSINSQTISETVDRNGLWHALTPQMFPLAELHEAITSASKNGVAITDEASAMEYMGQSPLLVEGHEDNIKITRQPDLKLAELYLQNQELSS